MKKMALRFAYVHLLLSVILFFLIKGTVGQFYQSSYYFTTTSCYPYTNIGTVYANGASGYTIASTGGNIGAFSISSSGLISASGSLTQGTYYMQVAAVGAYPTSVPVVVSVTCTNYNTNYNNGGYGVVFNNQPVGWINSNNNNNWHNWHNWHNW